MLYVLLIVFAKFKSIYCIVDHHREISRIRFSIKNLNLVQISFVLDSQHPSHVPVIQSCPSLSAVGLFKPNITLDVLHVFMFHAEGVRVMDPVLCMCV